MSNQRNSNRKQQNQTEVNDNYSLITKGFGFINYLKDHESDDGSTYTTCTVAAIVGSKVHNTRNYRYFDVFVRGQKTIDLLWEYQDELLAEEGAAMVSFVLSDVEPKSFTRNNGEDALGLSSNLIAIERIWFDGEVIYESSPQSDNEEQGSQKSNKSGNQQSRSNNRQNQRQASSGQRASSSKNSNSKASNKRGGRKVA